MTKINKKYLYIDKDYRTHYLQDSSTGKMKGRKRVPGRGDGTAVLRVKKSHPSRGGEIRGRTEPIPVRGSSRAKGTIRRRL